MSRRNHDVSFFSLPLAGRVDASKSERPGGGNCKRRGFTPPGSPLARLATLPVKGRDGNYP